MGMTIIEKICQLHTKDKVEVGAIIWLDIDVRSARDFGGANVIKNLTKEFSANFINDANKTFFTFDCCVPAKTIPYATNQHLIRLFAKENGVKVFDVNNGIGSHVLIEEQIVNPGSTVIGTDSHMNILGAITSFGQGMGDIDIAFAFNTGKTWFEIPNTIRVNIKNMPKENITPKDVILYILSKLKTKEALGHCIEYYGDYIDSLSLSGRITIASMATEAGAIISFLPYKKDLLNDKKNYTELKADTSVKYLKEITIDIKDILPQVALPGDPTNVIPVTEVKGKKIDSVFLGSCTNGRYEDILLFCNILKGKKISPEIVVEVVPSTMSVYKELLLNGIINDLFDSGVIVSNPGCGGCASGQIGMTGEREVQLSTSNRNFKGKQGAGETYLVSPRVAAFSALKGVISDE